MITDLDISKPLKLQDMEEEEEEEGEEEEEEKEEATDGDIDVGLVEPGKESGEDFKEEDYLE